MNLGAQSFEFTAEAETREVFSEAEQYELAAELLAAQNEQEFDQFLGSLLKRAGRVVGSVVKSPALQRVGGMLKGVAKQALPAAGSLLGRVAGGALGTAAAGIPGVGPVIAPWAASIGQQAGGALGGMGGRWLADRLEFESMSEEELEFEAARQFVRVAGEAVKNLSAAPQAADPTAAARTALDGALDRYAPAFRQPGRGGASGRWVRRGSRIIIYGA